MRLIRSILSLYGIHSVVQRPYRKLSPHIEVWKTPGHTQHDLTVLIHDVASYGTMAIVGDLIPNETLISERVSRCAADFMRISRRVVAYINVRIKRIYSATSWMKKEYGTPLSSAKMPT